MYYYTKQFFVTFFLLYSIFLPVMGSSFPKTFLSDIIDPTKTFDDIKTKSLEECLPTVLVAFGCATESLQKDNVRLKRLCTEQERKLAAHAATIAQLQAEINQLKQARIVQQAEVETSRQDDFLEHQSILFPLYGKELEEEINRIKYVQSSTYQRGPSKKRRSDDSILN